MRIPVVQFVTLLWLIAAAVCPVFSYLQSKPESLQNVLNACMYVYSM